MEEEQDSKAASGSQNSRSTHQHEISFPSHSWSLEMLLRILNAIEVERDDKLASVLDAVGEFGTFQWRLVALTFTPYVLLSFFMFSDRFMLTAQRPYCNTSWILEVGPNLSVAEQLNLTLPRAPNGSFLTCLMYIPVSWDLNSIIRFGLNYTETCRYGWIYPYAERHSLINEFDLVCGNEPNKENMQTVFLAGILTGSLFFGFLSDKIGRYPVFLMSLVGLLVFGFGTAFVSSFYQYVFFRFIAAQAAVGYVISSVSLVMEWLVGEHRAHAIILQHCFLALGNIFLSGSAFSIFHWRLLFLMAGTPMFPIVSNIWVVRESPQWLMVKGKVDEARKVLCYAAEVNKKTIPLNLLNEVHHQLHLFHTGPQVEGLWDRELPQTNDPRHSRGAVPAVLYLSTGEFGEKEQPLREPHPGYHHVFIPPFPPSRYNPPGRLPPHGSLPGLPSVSHLGWLAKNTGGGFLHVSFAPPKEAPAPKTARIHIQSPERGTQAIPKVVILVCEGRQSLGLHSSPHRKQI